MSYFEQIARSVSRYTPEDKVALRSFQAECFGAASRHLDDRFFEWLFLRNPHREPGGPPLWVCKRDGVVVGQQASIPTMLKIGEREQRAAWLIDWMIRPEWRLKGVAPALLAANTGTQELTLGLGLEDLVYKTVSRAGWREIGSLALFVRPFDTVACARVLKLPTVISALAPPRLVRGTARVAGTFAAAVTGLRLEHVSAFDERIDRVWANAKRDYPIIVKRDFSSVRWRFDESPHAALFDRYYVKQHDETIGYAVLRLTQWRGQTIGRVVDYLAPRRSAPALFALLLQEIANKGAMAAFLEQWHPGTERVLRSLGCVRIRTSHRLMFKLRDEHAELAAALCDIQNWFVTPADSDFDHVLIATEAQAAAVVA